MALKPLNSVAGFSVGETPANIILANGDVTTNNITTTGKANLNAIGNVIITGGTAGQVIQTDGSGNLSFTTINTAQLANGNSNVQVLANSNVVISVGGTSNITTFTSTGINVAGYITGANITATGNISVNNYIVTPANVDLIVAPDTQLTRFYSNVNPFSGGYSLGNSLARWDNVFANTANIDGNVSAGNVLTNNLLYANGQPWDLQEAAGSNTQIQYNDGNNNFGASAAFTFDYAGNILTVNGNANITGAVNTANINSGASTFVINANGFTTSFYANGLAEFDDGILTTGNLTVGNANLGNLTTASFVNVSSNITTNNLTVNLDLSGNTANFTGNVSVGNLSTTGAGGNITMSGGDITGANVVIANSFTSNGGTIDFATNNPNVQLGNVGNVHIGGGTSGYLLTTDGNGNLSWSATASTSQIFNGNSNVSIPVADGNVNTSVGGNANVFVVTGTGANVNGTLDISGNLTAANANLGNLVTANYGNFANDLVVQGNIANANNISVTNNITAGSANVTNDLDVGGNIITGNGTGGNISGVNVITANTFSGVTANLSGNITSLNANLGNLAQANFVNVASNLHTVNANVTGTLEVANANISSNLTVNNLTVNLELAGNTANFIGNVILSGSNVTVNNHLSGNVANFSGNITSLNANLGNIADANYLRTSEIYNGNSNVIITPNGNISLSATGLGNVVVVSNLGANIIGYVTANGDGSFGAVKSNSVTAQGGNLELYSEQTGNSYIQLRTFGDGTVDVGNVRITSLATPNASTDAATKQYVDDVAQGLNIHDSALAATANSLANLTGGTITYNNGTSGVGANLVLSGTPTANYLSANVFDGNVTAVVSSRILVKSEANAAYNGVYVVDSATVLTRATDYDSVPEVEAGDFIFVQDGTTYNDSGWVQTSVVATIGTDPIIFTQFSGAGTYQAGAGLTLTGTVFSVNTDGITTEISGGNVIVKANAQFTTPNIGAATGTSVDLTGNVLAGNVNSNAKVTGVDFEASANIIAGNISANANLVVNNATVNLELSGNTANFSGNVITNNLTTNLEFVGNTANFSGNIVALNTNAGNLLTANFANIASNVITSNLTVNLELAGNTANFSGNITGANVIANTAVFAPAVVSNASTYDTRVSLNSAAGIVEITSNGNSTKFNPSGQIEVSGASQIVGGTFGGSGITLGASQTDIFQNRGGNVTVQLGTAGSIANTWTFAQDGNLYTPGQINTSTINANTSVVVANTTITTGTVTTSSISANQTIASFNSTGVTGVEYLVKAVDATGSKYSVATVLAVTDGTDADYTIYGSAQMNGYTGSLAVNVSGGFIRLQVTPASSNSTVWTTQYRLI